MRKRSEVSTAVVSPAATVNEARSAMGLPALQPPVEESPPKTNGTNHVTNFAVSFPGEIVSVTWGEELVTVSPGNAYRVGPFSGSSAIRQGETRMQAMQRVYNDLAAFGHDAHVAKRASFDKAKAS